MRRAHQRDLELRVPRLLGLRLREPREDEPLHRRLRRRVQNLQVPRTARRADPGTNPQYRRRQAEVWEECGQSMPNARNPNATQKKIVHKPSTLSAPRRTNNNRTTQKDQNSERRKTTRPIPINRPRTQPNRTPKRRKIAERVHKLSECINLMYAFGERFRIKNSRLHSRHGRPDNCRLRRRIPSVPRANVRRP